MALLGEIFAAPASAAICLMNAVIWFVMWNNRIELDEVALSYEKAVTQRQFYRVITSTFTHMGVLHVAFNVSALYSVRFLEEAYGTPWYLRTTAVFVFLAGALHLAALRVGARWAPAWLQSSAVGYSGVVYAWIGLNSVLAPDGAVPVFGLFAVPSWAFPFAMLLANQLLLPRASFLGHLTGIIAGLAVAAGLLDSVSGYWLWTTVAYALAASLLSVKANPVLAGRLQCVALSPAFVGNTGLGGAAAAGGGAVEIGDAAAVSAAAAAPGSRRYISGGIIRAGPAALPAEFVTNAAAPSGRAAAAVGAEAPGSGAAGAGASTWAGRMRGWLAGSFGGRGETASAVAAVVPSASAASASEALGEGEGGGGAAAPAIASTAAALDIESGGPATHSSGGGSGGGRVSGRGSVGVGPERPGEGSGGARPPPSFFARVAGALRPAQRRGGEGGAYERVGLMDTTGGADDDDDSSGARGGAAEEAASPSAKGPTAPTVAGLL